MKITQWMWLGLALACSAQAEETVDSVVNPFIQEIESKVPGAAIGIYCKDQPYFFTPGFMNKRKQAKVEKDTIFELGSVSKVFTSTVLAAEVKKGHLKLGDLISPLLLQLPPGENRPVDRIRLVNLATHTASFPRGGASNRGKTNQELMEDLAVWRPKRPIGSQKNYSNYGYGLLSQVLADSTSKSYPAPLTFEELLIQTIAQPLQMTDTYVTVPESKRNRYAQGYDPDGSPSRNYLENPVWPGGGGVRSTIIDMMQFLKANLLVLKSAEAAPLMNAMKFAQTEVEVGNQITSALGWDVHPRQSPLLVSKNGSNKGFSSYIGMFPENKMGIVILTNRSAAAPGEVADKILRQLFQKRICQ